MAEIKWIKLNVDMFDDEKIKIIQSMPEGDSLLVIWIKLITLAGKTNDSGYIYIADNIPYTEEMLSVIMNKPLPTIRLAIDTFTKLQMVEADTKGIYLVNFEKHQSIDKMAKIKEQTRKRVAAYREKQRLSASKEGCNVTVTQCNATDIEEDIDKDKEEDKESKKKSKKFAPPTLEEVKAYCLERKNNVDAQKFYDYFTVSNWTDSKGNKVKNWKQKVITWENHSKAQNKANAVSSDWGAELEGVF